MMSCTHRQEDFDLVLSQSALDRCCYELTAFVDMFLGETIFEPVLDPTNVMVRAASIIRTAVSSQRDGGLFARTCLEHSNRANFLLTTSCNAATYKPQSSSKKKSVTLVNSREETDDWRNVQSALKGGVLEDDFDGLDGFGAFEL